MRFSVTFCALLLVTTTGIARADSSENVTAALQATTGMWRSFGFFVETTDTGKGVGIAGKTAEKNSVGRSKDPQNPGRVATVDESLLNAQLFVGTPNGNSQSVMASLQSTGSTQATFVSLNPATNKLISVTDCYTYGPETGRCNTVTRKTCDAIFPQSHLRSQKLQEFEECGELLREMKSLHKLDPSVEVANVARMKSIRPELRLTTKQDGSSNSIERLSLYYNELARVISLCNSAGGVERFEKASNPQSQNKSSGSAEAATQ